MVHVHTPEGEDPGRVAELPGAPPAPEGSGAPMTGRRVRLRPVFAEDYDYLYALVTAEEVAHRWRFRGVTPSPESFPQLLWHQVLAQFVIERNANRQRLGLVSAFDADTRNGFCHIAMLLAPDLRGTGWALEAGALFVNYLFTTWNFRKLYGEVLEFNYDDFASGAGRWFRVEGRLGVHEYHDGRYWDLLLLALYREDWDQLGPRLVERIASTAPDE